MRRRESASTDDVLNWDVRVQLLRKPCSSAYHRCIFDIVAALSRTFCDDRDDMVMHRMVEITLVRGGEAPPLPDVWHRISFMTPTFSMRRIDRICIARHIYVPYIVYTFTRHIHDEWIHYTLPTAWTFVLHEYRASSVVCLPAVGSTVVVGGPIEWGFVDVFCDPTKSWEEWGRPGRPVVMVALQPLSSDIHDELP